jgi:hypothetical protein
MWQATALAVDSKLLRAGMSALFQVAGSVVTANPVMLLLVGSPSARTPGMPWGLSPSASSLLALLRCALLHLAWHCSRDCSSLIAC